MARRAVHGMFNARGASFLDRSDFPKVEPEHHEHQFLDRHHRGVAEVLRRVQATALRTVKLPLELAIIFRGFNDVNNIHVFVYLYNEDAMARNIRHSSAHRDPWMLSTL